MRWMANTFMNLDKFFLKSSDMTLHNQAFKLFKENCFLNQTPRVV